MNESKATRYQRLRRRADAATVGSAVLMLAIIAFTPLGRWLSDVAHALARELPGLAAAVGALALFVILVVLLWELASLPAVIWLARRVDGSYGQTVPTVDEVVAAELRAAGLTLPVAFLAAGTVVAAVGVAGAWWWILAALVLGLSLAGALTFAPGVLARFAEVRPLARPELRAQLADLARRAQVPVTRVDEWMVNKSARTSALVTGVGGARRVLVSSELARDWSDDEIAVVVAHELAHHVHRDLWRTLALDAGVLSLGLLSADLVVRWSAARLHLSGPGDLAALPLIALVATAVWTMATPVRHAQSRRHERRADLFALAVTGRVEAFGAAIRRLGVRLLAEERPSALTRWLYHRHPTVAERLAMAEEYRRQGQNSVKLEG